MAVRASIAQSQDTLLESKEKTNTDLDFSFVKEFRFSANANDMMHLTHDNSENRTSLRSLKKR